MSRGRRVWRPWLMVLVAVALATPGAGEAARVLDAVFTTERISAPHTSHAAEVFLYLVDPAPR